MHLFRKNGQSAFAIITAFVMMWPSLMHAETFQEALAQAYTSNPELEAARASLRAVDEGVPEALSGWRPNASAQVQGGISHQEFNDTSDSLRPVDASISVTQPLFRGGRTVAQTKQAEESVLQERARLLQTEQTVLSHAANAYLDVLETQAILDLFVENEKTLEAFVTEAQERSRLGEKTRTDIRQAEARLARARADRNTVEVNLRAAHSAYRRFTGKSAGTLEQVKLKLPLPKTRQSAVDLANQNAPTVIAAEHALGAQKQNINVVRGNLFPELSLVGSAARSRNENLPQQNISDNHTENDQLVMQLKVPLYTGGADYARLRAAYQRSGEGQRNIDEARREAEEQAGQAWDRMQAEAANITVRQQQATAAQEALDGMQQEERVGDRTSTDKLNAQQELLDSKIDVLRASHDYAAATFDLTVAVGRFTADQLGLKVSFYDPKKHYEESRGRWFGTGKISQQ